MSRGTCSDKAVRRNPGFTRPLCVRAFTCVPSPVLSCLWRTPTCPSIPLLAPAVPDIADYAMLVRGRYGTDPATIPDRYYQLAAQETDTKAPGAGMYPTWLQEVPAVRDRVGNKVYYCMQAELYSSRVVWMGLPCRGRQILPEAVGQPTHPHFVGKAMLGVVKLDAAVATDHNCNDTHAWVVAMACGRITRLSPKDLRTILHADLGLPPHMRHQSVVRTLRTGVKVEIPYMPPYLHSPKTTDNSPLPTQTEAESGDVETMGEECVRIANTREYYLLMSGLKLGVPLDAQLKAKAADLPQGSTDLDTGGGVKVEQPPAKRRRVQGPKHQDTHDKISRVIETSWERKLKAADGDAGAIKMDNVLMDLSPQCVSDDVKAEVGEQWNESFIAFMRYFYHFYQHVPKVREMLQDAPCDGDFARIMKDPAMPTCMRILYSTFYVKSIK